MDSLALSLLDFATKTDGRLPSNIGITLKRTVPLFVKNRKVLLDRAETWYADGPTFHVGITAWYIRPGEHRSVAPNLLRSLGGMVGLTPGYMFSNRVGILLDDGLAVQVIVLRKRDMTVDALTKSLKGLNCEKKSNCEAHRYRQRVGML